MEEDEEFIKKLMTMLGNGRQLKLKSNAGQTIKVTLDGSSNYETQGSDQKVLAQIQSPPPLKSATQPEIVMEDVFEAKESEKKPLFSESLQEISDDFNALSSISEKVTSNQTLFNEQNFENMIIMDLEKLKEKESQSSVKTQDNVVKEFISQIQPKIEEKPKLEEKPKKISLANKSKKVANLPVIDFFKEQQMKKQESSQIKDSKISAAVNSSPLVCRQKEDLYQKSHSKSQKIQQNINLLKQRHPEEKMAIEMISERLHQLEEKEKIVNQSLSLINSSSVSMKLDSFDISVLSLTNKNSDDPLCYIMSEFLNRAKLGARKGKVKSIPSSFLFMFSQPLIGHKGREIEEQINYFQEEQIIQKTLKEGKCKVDYIHEPATVEKLHYWIKQGLQILHFCGHGVYDNQKQGNYLLFQNEKGQSVNVTLDRLTDLLKEGVQSLKLVFVASCHSQSTGKVFTQAGASHVICIRDDYQILDEACQQFVKLFYLTCINSKTTICEAFYFAKKQLQLKGKFTKHECQKFIILADHSTQNCEQYFEHRNELEAFNDLNPKPHYNKYLLSRVEHFIPRCRDMYEIIQLISQKRRFITITGQSGIGKSTIVRQLVRYIQFRNYFKDGIVYLQLSQCQNMRKIYEVLDLQLFQTSQLRLNKTPSQNMLRLIKQLSDKNLLLIFDNCQSIMCSNDRQNFKRLTQNLMKKCKDVIFVFTNRQSIGRQIDFCSEVHYQLGKLTMSQAKTLFFSKISRNIHQKEMDDFYKLDKNLKEIGQHSFFNFLDGHPQAICMTASLVAYRSLKQLYDMLMKPRIGRINQDIMEQEGIKEDTNIVVQTALRISLNVIKLKYKDAFQMAKILSLLPNGLEPQMMGKIFPYSGHSWRDTVKRLMNHSLVQCFQKGGSRYYLLHPNLIVQVEKEISQEEKIKYHDRICDEMVRRIKKLYEYVGTLSQYSARTQEIFLCEEDNFKAIFLRQLSFIGEKYPLKKFYQHIFKVQYEGMDQQGESNDNLMKMSTQIVNNYEKNKKLKISQMQKNAQKKESIDVIIVYYLTILFVVKKVKNTSLQTFLNYGIFISHKKNKYLTFANLLRIKACILLANSDQSEAKTLFAAARSQFAQLGCGLGTACCEAAIGYLKYCEHQYASAKMNLENALKYYDQIPHIFGKHYLNRWLCALKSKMNRGQKELIVHKREAQKLIKEAKSNLKSNNLNNISVARHKLGSFPFRFLFDNISLFLQATFQVDLRPKLINPINITTSVNSIFKQSKKNNFILDQINDQTPSVVPVASTKTASESVKRKQPKKMQKKKVEWIN